MSNYEWVLLSAEYLSMRGATLKYIPLITHAFPLNLNNELKKMQIYFCETA